MCEVHGGGQTMATSGEPHWHNASYSDSLYMFKYTKYTWGSRLSVKPHYRQKQLNAIYQTCNLRDCALNTIHIPLCFTIGHLSFIN